MADADTGLDVGAAASPSATAAGTVELVGRRAPRRAATSMASSGALASRARLRANLHDDVVRFLLGALFVAQVADLWTTHVALGSAAVERNPLFRVLFQSLPGLADAVKLGAVLSVAVVVLAALPLPRSRHALVLAAGISLAAPVANMMLLAGRI